MAHNLITKSVKGVLQDFFQPLVKSGSEHTSVCVAVWHNEGDVCVLRYDFFLVSQHVRQGTVTPTHYVVVHDGGNWDCDKVQMLTYKMTHLYYNWPGTVRVPAPCQVTNTKTTLTPSAG